MPTVTFTTPTDMMHDPFRVSSIWSSTPGAQSPTQFSYSIPVFPLTWTFTGSGFTYDDDVPISGTVTSFSLSGINGVSLTGVSLPVDILLGFVVTSDGLGLASYVLSGNDTIAGSSGSDTLNGFDGNDTINAGASPDIIYLSNGVDTIDGGSEIDTLMIDVSAAVTPVSYAVPFGGIMTSTGATFANGTVVRNVERLTIITGSGDDTVEITSLPTTFDPGVNSCVVWGNGGVDTFVLNQGGITFAVQLEQTASEWATLYAQGTIQIRQTERFLITTGSGADSLVGGSGNDVFNAGGGGDGLLGGDGADTLNGQDGDDFLIGGNGADTLNGGNGVDTATYTGLVGVTVNLATGTAIDQSGATDTLISIEDVASGDGADTVTGDGGANHLYGQGGNDVLNGGGGNDTLDGGPGDDIMRGGAGSDSFIGNGFDTVDYSGAAAAINVSMLAGLVLADGDGSTDTLSGITAITGSAFNDLIYGSNANNTLNGGAGNDALGGEGGDDNINGGAGVDRAYILGASTNVTWHRTASGSWVVDVGTFNTDTLTGIEILDFTDRDVALDNAQTNFYGNGASDILWRNVNNGQVAIWELNGATLTSGVVVGSGADPWTIINTGDFSGDGRDDILWRNTSDGQILAWRDGSWQSASFYGSVATSWVIAGVGDFNFDGRDDFLWRNTSDGLVGVWLLDGSASLSQGVIGAAPLDWTITAVADFDGDGRDDILWRHTSGVLARWTTDGVSQTGASIIGNVPTEWTVAGTGDFDGDGRADILWRNNLDGAVAIWRMNGDVRLDAGIPGGAPLSWHIVDVGDYNADGKDDLLWRNDDGTLAIWTMNGFTATAEIVAGVPTEWGVI